MTRRHCVILAGGLGTRLRPVTQGEIPKVLVPVLGRPFLDYKIRSLVDMGVTDITVLVGEKGEQVNTFLSTIQIPSLTCEVISDGPDLLGTAGAIKQATSNLPASFWVTYGDTYVTADLARAETAMKARDLSSVMTVFHNRGLLEPSNTLIHDDLVVDYRKSELSPEFEWIDYGLLFLPRAIFEELPDNSVVDLSEVIVRLMSRRHMLGFIVNERFWDIGTPTSFHETEEEFKRRGWG